MDWNGLQFSRAWETLGQSPRLLSLVSSTSAYTGGAHPNTNTKALLWDRRAAREISYRSAAAAPARAGTARFASLSACCSTASGRSGGRSR